ncbi:hypothetical protein [Kitasatospora sp. NPDC004531]
MTKLFPPVLPASAMRVTRRLGAWLRHRLRMVAEGPPDAGMSTPGIAAKTVSPASVSLYAEPELRAADRLR